MTTNHIETVRRYARAVTGGATDLTTALFRVYLAAAGATVRGAWVYIPGNPTALKGFRAAATYVLSLADTSRFLNDMANAIDSAEREVAPPTGLAGTPIRAADMTPLPSARTADDLLAVAEHVKDLAAQLAAIRPPEQNAETTIVVKEGDDLPDLLAADDRLIDRIVKRAVYDTGRALLTVLDGWIEGVIEDGEARELRDRPRTENDVTFHPDDIRRMVNDACRLMGAPEAYRESEAADR